MSALNTAPNLDALTDRQRQIWERSAGIGEFNGRPMTAVEIAKELGVTTNNVYVTKRRVRTILGMDSKQEPKRIIKQESNLDSAVSSLQKELDGYEAEVERLNARLEQIEREKPVVEAALDRLRGVTQSENDGVLAVA